jgi:hypothetical protein
MSFPELYILFTNFDRHVLNYLHFSMTLILHDRGPPTNNHSNRTEHLHIGNCIFACYIVCKA